MDELCRSADAVTGLPPWEAFATRLRRFVDYIATKENVMLVRRGRIGGTPGERAGDG